MAIINDSLYTFGGYNIQKLNEFYEFNINKHSWKKVKFTGKAPCPRSGHLMSSLKNKLYIYGGTDNNDKALNDFYEFNIYTISWK